MASGSVVYDATLHDGAVVSNNQLWLNNTGGQYMMIDPFVTGYGGLTFATWFRSDVNYDMVRLFDFGSRNDVWTDDLPLVMNVADNIMLTAEMYGTGDELTFTAE
eukprot:gene69559-biopygen40784